MKTELALVNSLDDWLDRLRDKLLRRLELGEERYGGTWRKMSVARLRQELEEELLDAMIYSLFIDIKRSSPES